MQDKESKLHMCIHIGFLEPNPEDSPIDAAINPLRTLVKYCLNAPMFEESYHWHHYMDQLEEHLELFDAVHSRQ
ncbi:hypothetical protein PGT21_016523 [Puccinia graminis f. sp. tritici]|uniref:Uncharacterized protein n=1 Tax=Puccinia graminis f. sp. tritici TaxID=56615 RepID=A0A5B0NPJ1_PUCGR|nr:hypothetical protein PGT21_016523 [Puccinia graminis f. sp. tritici]KAA1089829.1 hypothetical protein PGTUg99_020742 [Puccinia graminis f. sp. tritici]